MTTIEAKSVWSFQGRYASAMQGIAENAMRFLNCSTHQAERLANAFAADYGSWLKAAKDKGLKLKFSAVDADKHFTVTQIDELSTVITNPSAALTIGRTLAVVDKVLTLKNGILRDDCLIQLAPHLHDWLFQKGAYAPVMESSTEKLVKSMESVEDSVEGAKSLPVYVVSDNPLA